MNNSEAKIYLGKEIAKKLIRAKGSYKAVGLMFGVSGTTVGNIINGYYERLSIRMYMKLAVQMQMDIEVSVKDLE